MEEYETAVERIMEEFMTEKLQITTEIKEKYRRLLNKAKEQKKVGKIQSALTKEMMHKVALKASAEIKTKVEELERKRRVDIANLKQRLFHKNVESGV